MICIVKRPINLAMPDSSVFTASIQKKSYLCIFVKHQLFRIFYELFLSMLGGPLKLDDGAKKSDLLKIFLLLKKQHPYETCLRCLAYE